MYAHESRNGFALFFINVHASIERMVECLYASWSVRVFMVRSISRPSIVFACIHEDCISKSIEFALMHASTCIELSFHWSLKII